MNVSLNTTLSPAVVNADPKRERVPFENGSTLVV
jgi:hypothetical protein